MAMSAADATTGVTTVALLLDDVGSVVALDAATVCDSEPDDAVTVPVMDSGAAVAPEANPALVQLMVDVPVQVQPLPLPVIPLRPDGTVSVTCTEPVMAEGPALVTSTL